MLRTAFWNALRHPTSWVFLFVLVASLGMAFARAAPPLTSFELTWTLLLSAIYLIVGTLGFHCVLGPRPPLHKIIYLVFQIGLGLLILRLGRGNGWLVMLPLASHSMALFSMPEASLPCVIITLGIAWNTSQMIPDWIPFLQSTLVFGSAVFFAAAFTNISIRDTRRREEIERLAAQLEDANRALREYALKVEELAAVQERNRLARDIHDGLGHYLTTMHVELNLASATLDQDPPGARQALTRMQALLQEALADVRRSVSALRSEPTLGKSLPEAIQPLILESRAAGLETGWEVRGEVRPLSAAQEGTLYRAVQEGLTNARKHARAQQVQVLLDYAPEAVRLRVADDGVGSVPGAGEVALPDKSFGLLGLRERVQIAGGEMAIHTAPRQGFTLEITFRNA